MLMFGGMGAGYLLRKRRKLIRGIERAITWCIFLLLFLLGVSIGRNPLIMANLPSLGTTALIISLSGVAGSLLLALLIWKTRLNKQG